MTATPPFDIAQTAPARRGRALGWAASASVVALLLSGLAALAMAAAPSCESLGEDTAITVLLPPPAPPVTALGDPAPDVAAEAPSMAEAPPEVDTAPDLPDAAEAAPDRPDPAEPLSDPIAEAPPDTDATLPPEPAQLAEKMVQPVKEPEKPVGKPAKPPAKENVKPPAAEASAGGAAQPKAPAAKSAGKGKVADADYGASVLSKIRKTKKTESSRARYGSGRLFKLVQRCAGHGQDRQKLRLRPAGSGGTGPHPPCRAVPTTARRRSTQVPVRVRVEVGSIAPVMLAPPSGAARKLRLQRHD
jgi:periplasmic protein TonB